VGEKAVDRLTVLIFPSKTGSSSELYEDDGHSRLYQEGKYSLTRFEVVKSGPAGGTIIISKAHKGYKSGVKSYILQIHTLEKPGKIQIGAKTIEKRMSLDKLIGGTAAYFYQPEEKILYIKVDASRDKVIKISE